MTTCRDIGELDRRNEFRHEKMMTFIKYMAYVNLIGQAGFNLLIVLRLMGIWV